MERSDEEKVETEKPLWKHRDTSEGQLALEFIRLGGKETEGQTGTRVGRQLRAMRKEKKANVRAVNMIQAITWVGRKQHVASSQ